jgi:hypothetical protein
MPEGLELPSPTELWYCPSSRAYILQYTEELHRWFTIKDKARLNESAFLYYRYEHNDDVSLR